jgi:hypothetical protein
LSLCPRVPSPPPRCGSQLPRAREHKTRERERERERARRVSGSDGQKESFTRFWKSLMTRGLRHGKNASHGTHSLVAVFFGAVFGRLSDERSFGFSSVNPGGTRL